jgi:two-component system, chemotaxis family, response regulator Rcp1
MKGNLIEILLVEDNPGDVRLVREVFKDAKVANNIHVAEDGVEAMAFLRKEGRFAGVVRPDLVLLDLNLPKKDGREVLTEIKTDDALKRIPVIVLTTSSAEEDIMKSYSEYANSYITKPINLSQFINVVRSIEDFWLTIVKLPPNGKQ